MDNDQLKVFSVRQKELEGIMQEVSGLVRELDMSNGAKQLEQLKQKIASDSFKVMIMGNFKNGKSTFINAILGQEILPAYATPTTAIINEVKYGQTSKATLHFLNPQPEKLYDGIPDKALSHMQRFKGGNIPPIEMPVDDVEDYVVIPMGMDHKEASRQSPFEKVELFWPLDLLQNGVEIVDSPGLNENPARTQVTLEYLSKADAIIFVFSGLAMGSAGEISYIEDTLSQYGFENQSLFCVVNRFDQLTNDRERERVRKFSDNLLSPYTKHIYYTSGYKGLMGKTQNDPAMLKESMMPEVEEALADYLANDRGKIKLATPARELNRIIRKEALETTIPQRRNALSTDLNVLKQRYNEAKPEIEKLRQQKELIISKAEAKISSMMPEVRRCAINYFNNLPGQIRVWVDEYEPETKVSALHIKRDATALAEEVESYTSSRLDREIREWLGGPFASLVNDKVETLKDSLEGRLEEFFVSLDQLKLEVTGTKEYQAESVPVWQRVVAAGGGLLIGDVGVAALGATTGLTKDFAKGIALQLGAYFVLALVGLLNPVTIIAVIVGSIIHGGAKGVNRAEKSAKEQVTETYCEELSKSSSELVETAVNGVQEEMGKVKDMISQSMDVEINEMQQQMEGLIKAMEQGQKSIQEEQAKLLRCEQRLQQIAENVDSFIFKLLK